MIRPQHFIMMEGSSIVVGNDSIDMIISSSTGSGVFIIIHTNIIIMISCVLKGVLFANDNFVNLLLMYFVIYF